MAGARRLQSQLAGQPDSDHGGTVQFDQQLADRDIVVESRQFEQSDHRLYSRAGEQFRRQPGRHRQRGQHHRRPAGAGNGRQHFLPRLQPAGAARYAGRAGRTAGVGFSGFVNRHCERLDWLPVQSSSRPRNKISPGVHFKSAGEMNGPKKSPLRSATSTASPATSAGVFMGGTIWFSMPTICSRLFVWLPRSIYLNLPTLTFSTSMLLNVSPVCFLKSSSSLLPADFFVGSVTPSEKMFVWPAAFFTMSNSPRLKRINVTWISRCLSAALSYST